MEVKAKEVGILATENEDIRSLCELLTYGVKGMAAYVEHAYNLGFEDTSLYAFMQDALVATTRSDLTVADLTQWVLTCGEYGVKAMALLDKANTSTYGNPEITKVNIGVGKNPGILISGHDLRDIQDLLEQTEGTGIDVYTHSEMLPAHYYPAFKKYKHFVGNYGSAWWKQQHPISRHSMELSCLRPTALSLPVLPPLTPIGSYDRLYRVRRIPTYRRS